MSREHKKWQRSLGMVGIGAVVGFSVLGLGHSIRNSDRFSLRRIEVSGAERVSADGVRRLSGLELGRNLFDLDLEGAELQIEAHPMVRRVRVRRQLPDGVEVVLEEWTPSFLVALGRTYVADASGQVIKALEASDEMDLPLVTGIDRSEVRGQRLPRLTEVSALAQAWSEAGLPRPSEIHVPALGPSTVRTRDGWEAVLAAPRHLDRLAEAVTEAERKGPIRRVRVDGGRREGRITVAWEVNDG